MNGLKIFFKNLYFLVFLVVIFRLVLSFLPSFWVDMSNWIAWSRILGEGGIAKFYSSTAWTNYTPGFLYYLWFLGILDKIFGFNNLIYPILIKLPVVIADISIGLIIFNLLKRYGEKIAIFGFLAYSLNPAVIFADSIWGQTDGLISLFLVLSAVFLFERKNIFWGWGAWGFALLVKPQALAALPVLVFFSIKSLPIKKIYIAFSAVIFSTIVVSLPFFTKDPLLGLPKIILKMANESPFTSVMAFNFWSLVRGMWIHDNLTFMGLPYIVWGLILLSTAILVILFKLYRSNFKKEDLYKYLGLSFFAFFLFPTRVHERYLLAAFPFLLIWALLSKSKKAVFAYFSLGILSFLNLYYPYSYYTPESFLSNKGLSGLILTFGPFISLALIVLFFVFLFWGDLAKVLDRTMKNSKEVTTKLKNTTAKWFLLAILTFSFFTRVGWLWQPKNEYFDEVYHAFTAKVMLHNDPKAWEWWNTPPEGFAYEWTHPPLAKELMVVGMKIFGENSFGYRIPGALLGVGISYLVYKIGKELFKDEVVGLLSAAVFSLDGLALVMSRIGMNDTYFLFFVLLSIYFYIKDKNLFSAISFGLAAVSKWSAIWAIPIFIVLHFVLKKKFKLSYLWFLLLPFTIYLLTYLPMFFSGHTWANFVEVQKQMWWYHTRLRATHPYTSLWWSWPIMARPIYLYTSDEVGGWVSRIYAMGNPVVFWFGLFSIVLSAVYSYLEKNKNLAFVVFGYLIFFVPWAASPRIMFLYHYLPSIPFLAIATGYILRRFPKLATCYLLLATILFIYFYPHWAGLRIPLWLDSSYYWFASWR